MLRAQADSSEQEVRMSPARMALVQRVSGHSQPVMEPALAGVTTAQKRQAESGAQTARLPEASPEPKLALPFSLPI
ncbi:MAG: hypothetical protein CUN53_17640 [Phototrophicales bacterium]|nr:MAG: hypothetical protein CUN53_17640 [Phototrophicales bacterium]